MIELFAPLIAYTPEQSQYLDREFWEIVIKIMIPSAFAIGAKIAIQNRHQKISRGGIAASIISGLVLAYLSGKVIIKYIPNDWIGLASGAIAISAEHIIATIIYKFKWDAIGDVFFESLKSWIRNKVK